MPPKKETSVERMYPNQRNDMTYPTKQDIRNIIDSRVPHKGSNISNRVMDRIMKGEVPKIGSETPAVFVCTKKILCDGCVLCQGFGA